MGVLRPPCYKAPCRTYAGGERSNQIIWYFVDDSHPFYEELHAYSPMRDEMYTPSDTAELSGRIPNPRKYSTPNDPFHHIPHGVHGDPEDFLCQSPLSKFSPHGEPPADPCDESQTLVPLAGVKIGGKVIDPRPVFVASGLLLGGKLLDPVSPFGPIKSGLQLGGKLRDLPTAPLAAGVLLGGKTRNPVDPLGPVASGVQLGAKTSDAVDPLGPVNSGLLLGGVINSDELVSALELGGKLHGVTPPDTPEELKSGLELGGKLREGGATPEPPGGTCSTAGNWGPLGSRTESVAIGSAGWWYFAGNPSTTYHVRLTINSGDFGSINVYRGDDCATQEFVGSLFTSGSCVSFTLDHVGGSYLYCWIAFTGALVGTDANVTIELQTGGC